MKEVGWRKWSRSVLVPSKTSHEKHNIALLVLLFTYSSFSFCSVCMFQENFVRVSLFKFNLLGKMDRCHVIDKYTLLKDMGSFLKALDEQSKLIQALGGNLAQDIRENPKIFDKAADYCQRVANKEMLPGCKACNLMMSRPAVHADIIYRCYPQTAELHMPELEDSMSKTISKGNASKKVVQQIALFFKQGEDGAWKAREDVEIMPLACLWRCVANLCLWAKSGKVRYRLIAVFYAALLLYDRLLLKDVMLFIDWHMHVFRVFYMGETARGTFFGMDLTQATLTFNTTRKAGAIWCSVVEHHMEAVRDKLDAFFRSSLNLRQVLRFKEAMTLYVNNERALFCFLSRKAGVRSGIKSIMSFYMYNFKESRALLLHMRGKLFIKEIMSMVAKELSGAQLQVQDKLNTLSLEYGDEG